MLETTLDKRPSSDEVLAKLKQIKTTDHSNDTTPLFIAANNSNLEAVQSLIKSRG